MSEVGWTRHRISKQREQHVSTTCSKKLKKKHKYGGHIFSFHWELSTIWTPPHDPESRVLLPVKDQ